MKIFHYAVGFSLTGLINILAYADVTPNSGQLLQQQIQPITTPINAELLEQTSMIKTGLQGEAQIDINRVIIEGNTQFSTDVLHTLIADIEGKYLSLNQLQSSVDRITAYYHQHGYLYSRAYLPQQTLSGGVVRIVVLEALIDAVNIQNYSRTQDWLIKSTLASLKKGEHINYVQMQQQLKLINRLNGVNSRNVLTPGTAFGTSQLNIELQDQQLVQAVVGLDNYGNEYLGRSRFNIGIVINNVLGLGDPLSFDVMSTGKGLNYGKIGYSTIVNGFGTELGLSQSYLNYDLEKEMAHLGAEGTAVHSSVWIKHPILFNHLSELFLSLQYDYKVLEDNIQATNYYKDRDINIVTIKFDGSQYDQFGAGGLTQYGVSSSYGYIQFNNDTAAKIDEQSAKTQGKFYSGNIYLTRLQNLNHKGTQGYLALYGQYSPDNLDSSEQYISGGAFSVRGYEQSQFSGSSGYLVRGELRQPLYEGFGHQLIGKLFTDYARVKFNAKPWGGLPSKNYVAISSAGMGLQWRHKWNIQANLDVALPMGSRPNQLMERDEKQVWLNVNKFF